MHFVVCLDLAAQDLCLWPPLGLPGDTHEELNLLPLRETALKLELRLATIVEESRQTFGQAIEEILDPRSLVEHLSSPQS